MVDLGLGMLVLAGAIVCATASCLARAAISSGRRDDGERRVLDKQAVLARATRAVLQASPEGGAVPQWQQAVVAIGSRSEEGPPRLVGSGFFVDARAHVLVTCCHVIDDIVLAHRTNGPAAALDPHSHGVAIGFGSPVVWTHLAVLRHLSPPPAPRDVRNGLDLAVLQLVGPLPTAPHALVPFGLSALASAHLTPTPESSASSATSASSASAPPPAPPDGAAPPAAELALLEAGELERALMEGCSAHASAQGGADAVVNAPRALRTSPSTSSSSTSSTSTASSSTRGASAVELATSPSLSPTSSDAFAMRAAAALPAADLPAVTALPLGHEGVLAVGEDVVLLGYGRAGRGGPPSATNTRGVFAGRCEHPQTGSWLRTDALMLSGHSGGPLLNGRGEVIGWSVRSGFDKVVNGEGYYAAGLNEVRPASALRMAVTTVLGGRPPLATLAAGTHQLMAAQAREAAIAAIERALADDSALSRHSPSAISSPRLSSPRLEHLSSPRLLSPRLSSPCSSSSVRTGGHDGDARPAEPPRTPRRRRKRNGSGSGIISLGLNSAHLSFSLKIKAPSLPRLGRRSAPASVAASTTTPSAYSSRAHHGLPLDEIAPPLEEEAGVRARPPPPYAAAIDMAPPCGTVAAAAPYGAAVDLTSLGTSCYPRRMGRARDAPGPLYRV